MIWRWAAIGLVVTAMLSAYAWLRPAQQADAPLLPMNFAHKDHTAENCIVCHHNFVDDTGQQLCIDCHKRHAEVGLLIEEQFHTLCRSCHVERQREGKDAGPTRSCIDCHQQDPFP